MVQIEEVADTFWRSEFRVSGTPEFHSEGFVLEIHHGGKFVEVGNGQHKYVGGEVHWPERLDPDQTSCVELNTFAWRLGYRQPPVIYWYKHPYLPWYIPVKDDNDAMKMIETLPKNRTVVIYFVGGGMRRAEEAVAELELDNYVELIPHTSFKPEIVMGKLRAVDNGQSSISGTTSFECLSFVGSPFGQIEGHAFFDLAHGVSNKGQGAPTNKAEEGKGKAKVQQYIEEESEEDNSTDEDYVPPNVPTEPPEEELVDSDYEINPEDDNEVAVHAAARQDDADFQKHVDNEDVFEEYHDMGYGGYLSDDGDDSEELRSQDSDSDEDGDEICSKKRRKKKVKLGRVWVPERDLKDPHFEVGQHFANCQQFRDAVKKYAVKNGFDLRFNKNTKKKIEVICGPKLKGRREDRACPFWIFAGKINNISPELAIKTCELEHGACPVVPRVKFCTSTFLAKEYVNKFKVDPYMSKKLFQEMVNCDFGQTISHKQVIKTRKLAADMNSGSEAEQYNLLETYAAVLRKTNPNSTVKMMTEMEGDIRKFKRFYVCFDAVKKGWKKACRPFIGLDGCHIKSNYPGQLLSAVGIDANNGMFPIAYAVVEMENRETWTWFMELLVADLELNNGPRYVFMSDKQKGLLDAVEDLVPGSEHRHCVRHFHNNFKKKNGGIVLKNLLWAAARDTTMVWFNKHMDDMFEASEDAVKWLADHDHPSHWSRSHFSEHTKCDMLLNNVNESWNSVILECRDKPILVMQEWLRQNVMIRLNNRRVAALKWKVDIGPRIHKIIKKNSIRAREYQAFRSSDHVFEIHYKGGSILQVQHSVDLAKLTCTCRRWMLSGLPCPHAIAAIWVKGDDPIAYVHEYYKKQSYLDTYSYSINPVPGIEMWNIIRAPIQPPPYRRQPGRPKMVRIREEGEEPPAASEARPTKLPRSRYVTMSCRVCGSGDHNKRTCMIELGRKATERNSEVNGNVRVNVDNQGPSNVNVSVESRGTNNVQVQVQTTAAPKSNEKAKRMSKQPANRAPRKGGKTSASVVSTQRSSNGTPAPISQPTHTFPASYSQPTQSSILKRQNMPE